MYYNNVSLLSEVLKLAQNPKLKEIDVRLNPVSVMSTEYRLMLVHALTSLTLLGESSLPSLCKPPSTLTIIAIHIIVWITECKMSLVTKWTRDYQSHYHFNYPISGYTNILTCHE